MNRRSSRGPNCCDVSESVTMVIENTVPVTATIAPATAERVARAASVVVRIDSGGSHPPRPSDSSTSGSTSAMTTAPTANSEGTNQ